jgi:hypothetical protein
MMAKIVTRANSDQIVGWIVEFLCKTPTNLIRIEGVCGSGKTTISRRLAAQGIGAHVEADTFAFKPTRPTAYPQCLRREELDGAISNAVRSGETVILDAICLDEVAPAIRWGHGLKIYVKRLSFSAIDPIWHEGFRLEDDPPTKEPERSVYLYHNRVLPHMNADLIVEFPEDLHRLPEVPYSRERCFDPPNSVIVE